MKRDPAARGRRPGTARDQRLWQGPRRVHLGLPYSAANARLLERVLFYASHNEDKYAAWSSSNPECEVAHFPEQGLYCVINNTDQPQKTTVTLADGTTEDFDLPDSGIAWREA